MFVAVLFSLTVLNFSFADHIPKVISDHPNFKYLDRGKCGSNLGQMQKRILGGKKANLGQYPWIVRIGYAGNKNPKVKKPDTYLCAGSIISDRYVITAAHCDPKWDQHMWVQVRAGEHNIITEVDCENGVCAPPYQDRDIESYSCHRGFTTKILHHDICLLRLAKPLKFNKYVQPICLPIYDVFEKSAFKNEVMEVAGWGFTNYTTETIPKVLNTLQVPILSEKVCSSKYSNYADPIITIVCSQICGGGILNQDNCDGDSGGPLMKKLKINGVSRYFLIGVVSFGNKICGAGGTPSVYTRVSSYIKWILDNVEK